MPTGVPLVTFEWTLDKLLRRVLSTDVDFQQGKGSEDNNQ